MKSEFTRVRRILCQQKHSPIPKIRSRKLLIAFLIISRFSYKTFFIHNSKYYSLYSLMMSFHDFRAFENLFKMTNLLFISTHWQKSIKIPIFILLKYHWRELWHVFGERHKFCFPSDDEKELQGERERIDREYSTGSLGY